MLFIVLSVLLSMDIFDPAAGAFLDDAPDADAVFARADSAYRIGDYETSAGLYLQGLQVRPWDSGSIYNLACCYGLLGRGDLAAAYLQRAWDAGFDDIGHIQWDPDFESVREDAEFAALVEELQLKADAEAEALGQQVFFHAEGPFSCRVKLPEGYDGSSPVPLVIGLHGLGGSPETFIGLWEVVGDYGCIFTVPQAPSSYMVGSRIGYTWFTGDDWVATATLSRDYVLTLLDTLEVMYNVSDVYLFGYSQGGGMTYMTGLHAPERFAALAPFSGWLDTDVLTEEELAAASDIPVRIFHGEQDRVVDYQGAVFADSLTSALGYDVELITFQGEHMFSRDGLRDFLDEFLGN